MLDPNIKTAWVAALRSDDYKQAETMLRTPDGRYCCIGVLCEITNTPTIGDAVKTFVDPNGARMKHLPTYTMCGAWGVESSALEPYWEMNDQGTSFAEIADAIEKDARI